LQAGITSSKDMTSTFDQIKEAWTRLDVLVLNASGGLEKDKTADDDSTER
jgi:NADP-dependent 3-hydroxy acid dehydrogenase YdfG